MRSSAKTKRGMSQSCIEIMSDAIKAKEQNLSYGKFKALDMLGAGSMQDDDYVSEYQVHTANIVRKTEQTEKKKAVAFVKVRS
ncbi:hypothetical protein [Butyrivibrio sp. YAB3001]|uniref:hypothetical protein n=1 Tax=Butyrivibrio sp. YAB3001 TaxID=1520812 RepID=UPI0008F652CA|nr:hypothetical protein [Butyrivibrio sp. YAB3001]SFC40998.1 hypothetical protein SAMN02910398_02186 [Butyrivibrio sp. YAB3001]